MIPHPTVAWRQARAIRNVIVHVYFSVNERSGWDTIANALPGMEADVERVLTQENP